MRERLRYSLVPFKYTERWGRRGTNSLGHALIRQVTIEIGGQKIDQQYGMWLEIWDENCPEKCFLKENASTMHKVASVGDLICVA